MCRNPQGGATRISLLSMGTERSCACVIIKPCEGLTPKWGSEQVLACPCIPLGISLAVGLWNGVWDGMGIGTRTGKGS